MEQVENKKGMSAVIFDNNGDYYFLIFHRVLGWEGWEFIKGEYNEGEEWKEAVFREVVRETGLSKFRVHKKLDIKYEFTMPDGTQCSNDVFLIETSMNIPVNTKSNDEHDTYLWATFDSAIDKLEFPEQKEMFRNAFEEIKKLN